MAISGHHHAPCRNLKARLIVHLTQEFIIESSQKQLLDQLRHGATTAAVSHVDVAVFKI